MDWKSLGMMEKIVEEDGLDIEAVVGDMLDIVVCLSG